MVFDGMGPVLRSGFGPFNEAIDQNVMGEKRWFGPVLRSGFGAFKEAIDQNSL